MRPIIHPKSIETKVPKKKKKKKTLKLKANEHSISWKLCKAITCKQYTC